MSPVARLIHRQAGPVPPPQLPASYMDETDKEEVIGIPAVFTGLAFIVVLLRMYVRTVVLKSVGGDDYGKYRPKIPSCSESNKIAVMIIAMTFAIVVLVCQSFSVEYGVGHHAQAIQLMNMSTLLQWRFYQGLVAVAAVSLVKISVGLALLRLFQRKAHRYFLWGSVIFLAAFTIASLGTIAFQCSPIHAAWNIQLQQLPSTRCFSMHVFRDIGLWNSSINIITDVLFACMPIPLIWKLQMNTRTKITLICVLGLGFFAVAAGLVKSIYQYNFFSTLDWSFHDSFMVWAFIELNIGIIAASLPSLKPFFNWLLKTARTLGSGLSSHARQYNSPSLAYGQSDRKEPKVTEGYVLEPVEGRIGVPNRAPSRAKNLYGVHISSGEDIRYITNETTWEPPRSKNSNDFILPKRRPPTPEAGILMTTEFRVS